MTTNKFDNFYGRKPIIDCIKQLLAHKTETLAMDMEWYEGLVEHLLSREMDEELKKMVQHIINTDATILKKENILADLEVKDAIMAEENPVRAAGANLINASKNLFIALIAVAGSTLIRLFLLIPKNSIKTSRKSAEMLTAVQIFFDIATAVIVLGCLFTAYSQLKKSGENLYKFTGK